MLLFLSRNLVLQSVCRELLSSKYSEQVSQFILPALAYGKQPFPFIDLLHALLPLFFVFPVEETKNRRELDLFAELKELNRTAEWKLTVEPSLWLLSSVLHLGQNHIGKTRAIDCKFNEQMNQKSCLPPPRLKKALQQTECRPC